MGVLSIVNCIDNTGVVNVKIIKVFGHSNKRVAKIGDRVSLVISSINLNTKNMKDHRRRHRLRRGTIHKGIVVQTKQRFHRANKTWLKFTRNAIVLVDRKNTPLGKKIKGIIPLEVAYKYPKVASISTRIV